MAKRRNINRSTAYDRPIHIDVCKDGTISYRAAGTQSFNGVALPVFSVNTVAEAKAIQVRFGRAQYIPHPDIPGQTWYRWTDFTGDVDQLAAITQQLEAWWNQRPVVLVEKEPHFITYIVTHHGRVVHHDTVPLHATGRFSATGSAHRLAKQDAEELARHL